MNCRRVEKLIPLYIEGDLRFKLANRVKTHVDNCSRCCALADEYRASQCWLRSAELAEFDDVFFNELKRGVLKQVDEADARASALASLAGQWGRRQMLPLTAAVLVTLAAVAFYFYHSTNVSSAITKDITQPTGEKIDSSTDPQRTVVSGRAQGGGFKRRHVAQAVSLRTFISRDQQWIVGERMNSSPSDADSAAGLMNSSLSDTDSAAGLMNSPRSDAESHTGGESDSRPMLRIEFQTSDPNIRIIWFAPSQTDSHQSKPATD